EVDRARWLFPLYLIALLLFVVPLAAAGLVQFPGNGIERDTTVLALPLSAGAPFIAGIGYIAGLSAATAMAIVACVATSVMISNNVVMPIVLAGASTRPGMRRTREFERAQLLLNIRRGAICALLLLAYAFETLVATNTSLASVGLLAFAAIAQLAPAFFGGLFWARATSRGAYAGILTGLSIWVFTLLIPWFAQSGLIGPDVLTNGLFGMGWMRPEALFGIAFNDPLVHAVVWSLSLNALVFVVFSYSRALRPLEHVQARQFGLMPRVTEAHAHTGYFGGLATHADAQQSNLDRVLQDRSEHGPRRAKSGVSASRALTRASSTARQVARNVPAAWSVLTSTHPMRRGVEAAMSQSVAASQSGLPSNQAAASRPNPQAAPSAARLQSTRIQISDLIATVADYAGQSRAERAFLEHARLRHLPFDQNQPTALASRSSAKRMSSASA
ncbi:MAG: hypothetical protein AAFO79_11610, partial [Pseudomonadota bacterium]